MGARDILQEEILSLSYKEITSRLFSQSPEENILTPESETLVFN